MQPQIETITKQFVANLEAYVVRESDKRVLAAVSCAIDGELASPSKSKVLKIEERDLVKAPDALAVKREYERVHMAKNARKLLAAAEREEQRKKWREQKRKRRLSSKRKGARK